MVTIPDKITRPFTLGNALKHEYDRDFCRETKTLKAGTSLLACGLVGEITTTGADKGKIKPWDPDATDGTQTVTGLACNEYEAPVGVDNDLVQIIVRGPAILFSRGIAWPSNADAADKAAAIASLKALSILVR